MRDAISRAGVFARFRDIVEARCQEEIGQSRRFRGLSADASMFVQGGVFGLMERWHNDGSGESVRRMTQRIYGLTARVLAALRAA